MKSGNSQSHNIYESHFLFSEQCTDMKARGTEWHTQGMHRAIGEWIGDQCQSE